MNDFAGSLAVDWTNNVSERGAKAAKRHQAVSGYWHSLATLAGWCRIAATSIRPPPTASPHSAPSAQPSKESPGYRRSPQPHDANS